MSLRPRAAAPTAKDEGGREQKTRLDCALRAGLVEQERRNGSAPTGVGALVPLLSGVITQNNQPPLPPPPSPPPDTYYNTWIGQREGGARAYSSAIEKGYLKDTSITVRVGVSVMSGTYTGETINDVPEGNGEFVVTPMSAPMSAPVVDDKYGELQYRVKELKRKSGVECSVFERRQHTCLLHKKRLREARKAVETEAAIPTEAYDAAWKDIKAFCKARRQGSTDVTVPNLVRWGLENKHQLDLFGANKNITLNNLRDKFFVPMVVTGDKLGGVRYDSVMTTSEWKSYIAALRRGEVDITPDRHREPTAAKSIFYNYVGPRVLSGDFTGGAFVGGFDTTVSTVNDEKHTLTIGRTGPGLKIDKVTYEMRQGDKLLQRIVLGRQDEFDPTLFRGNVKVLTRNRVHRFAWSGPAERVKMREGTAHHPNSLVGGDLSSGSIVLNGIAKVCVTVNATGDHIWLSGNMVDNRLMGKVTANVPVPGIDGLVFYVDGYDKYDVPIVRVSAKSSRSPPSPPSRPSRPSPPSPKPKPDAGKKSYESQRPDDDSKFKALPFWQEVGIWEAIVHVTRERL